MKNITSRPQIILNTNNWAKRKNLNVSSSETLTEKNYDLNFKGNPFAILGQIFQPSIKKTAANMNDVAFFKEIIEKIKLTTKGNDTLEKLIEDSFHKIDKTKVTDPFEYIFSELHKGIEKAEKHLQKANESKNINDYRKAEHYYKISANYIDKLNKNINNHTINSKNGVSVSNLRDNFKISNLCNNFIEKTNQKQIECRNNIFKINISPEALAQTNAQETAKYKAIKNGNGFYRMTEQLIDGQRISMYSNQRMTYTKEGVPIPYKNFKKGLTTFVVDLSKDNQLKKNLDFFNNTILAFEKLKGKNLDDLEKIKHLCCTMKQIFPEKGYIQNNKGETVNLLTWSNKHVPHRDILLGEFISGTKDGIRPGEAVCLQQSMIAKVFGENNGMNVDLIINKDHAWTEIKSKNGDKFLFDPRAGIIADFKNATIYSYDSYFGSIETYDKDFIIRMIEYKNNKPLTPDFKQKVTNKELLRMYLSSIYQNEVGKSIYDKI
ncbi:MAG: hypothetical protein WCK67_04535 [bacterium]